MSAQKWVLFLRLKSPLGRIKLQIVVRNDIKQLIFDVIYEAIVLQVGNPDKNTL